jgi:hypothetical protein
MKETLGTKVYVLNQLGTKSKQKFEFSFTPESVTSKKRAWFGKDELALLEMLILRTKYLYSILPCLETKDAICFLEWSRDELELLTEQVSKKEAVAYATFEKVKGHIYNISGPAKTRDRQLIFIRRSGGAISYDREWPGIQSQEIIRMLIARIKHLGRYLDKKSVEMIVWTLRMTLFCYEFRAKRRKEEEVNRKADDHDDGERYKPWRHDYFLDGTIENMKVGTDGHIILPTS